MRPCKECLLTAAEANCLSCDIDVPQTADVLAESDVVVMTTEILRNIMYRSQAEEAGTTEDRLADVGLVVLDEARTLAPTRPSARTRPVSIVMASTRPHNSSVELTQPCTTIPDPTRRILRRCTTSAIRTEAASGRRPSSTARRMYS